MGKEKTQFKKGQSGNPGGRKKLPAELRTFKETTYEDFLNQLQKYGSLSPDEMEADLRRKDATMFERIFGKIIQQAANGEKDGRQVLLERLWGKVKDQVEVSQTGKDKEQEELLSMIPVDELIAIIRKRQNEAKEKQAASSPADDKTSSP